MVPDSPPGVHSVTDMRTPVPLGRRASFTPATSTPSSSRATPKMTSSLRGIIPSLNTTLNPRIEQGDSSTTVWKNKQENMKLFIIILKLEYFYHFQGLPPGSHFDGWSCPKHIGFLCEYIIDSFNKTGHVWAHQLRTRSTHAEFCTENTRGWIKVGHFGLYQFFAQFTSDGDSCESLCGLFCVTLLLCPSV